MQLVEAVEALPRIQLHLRCRGCASDVFRFAHLLPARTADRAVRRTISGMAFRCAACPSETASLVGYKPVQEVREDEMIGF